MFSPQKIIHPIVKSVLAPTFSCIFKIFIFKISNPVSHRDSSCLLWKYLSVRQKIKCHWNRSLCSKPIRFRIWSISLLFVLDSALSLKRDHFISLEIVFSWNAGNQIRRVFLANTSQERYRESMFDLSLHVKSKN